MRCAWYRYQAAGKTQESMSMRKWTVSIAVLAALACAGPVTARAGSRSSAWDKLSILLTGKRADDNFKLMHVADLAALRTDPNSHVVILDANVEDTRDKYGVIPGAHLLTTYDNYDVATELPPARNAKLVFYCANTR
jgi:hypothetical protein